MSIIIDIDEILSSTTQKEVINNNKLAKIINKYRGKFYNYDYYLDLVEEYQKLKDNNPIKDVLLDLIVYEVEERQ